MSKKKEGRIEFLEDFPKDVVAVKFNGYIDGDQFETVLKPIVAERIKEEGKVKLFYVLGKDFDKVSSGFAWDDANFAVRHMRHVAKIAIVTDKKWLRKSAHFFSRLVPPEVRVFRLGDMDAAKEWITEYKPPLVAETKAEAEARERMAKAQKAILPIEQQAKAQIAAELLAKVWPLLKAGRIAPVMDSVFALESAAKAHAWMEAGSHIGKIVLKV